MLFVNEIRIAGTQKGEVPEEAKTKHAKQIPAHA